MQIVKATLVLSCLLLVGPRRLVDAGGLDLYKASDCAEIAIEAGVLLSAKAIPLVKNAASCINYTPQKVKDLDAEYLVLIAYKFIQSITGSQKCMQDAIDKVNGYINPFVTKFSDNKCLPSI